MTFTSAHSVSTSLVNTSIYVWQEQDVQTSSLFSISSSVSRFKLRPQPPWYDACGFARNVTRRTGASAFALISRYSTASYCSHIHRHALRTTRTPPLPPPHTFSRLASVLSVWLSTAPPLAAELLLPRRTCTLPFEEARRKAQAPMPNRASAAPPPATPAKTLVDSASAPSLGPSRGAEAPNAGLARCCAPPTRESEEIQVDGA